MNMKAILKTKEEAGVELRELPIPKPGPKEVLVKVKAAAICGTDLHIYEWNAWAQRAVQRLPIVLGHEFSGEVVEVGKAVERVRVGDYIAGESHIPCGRCYQCLNGFQHICGNLKLFGVDCDGCFAEYAIIPEICARKIPEVISPEIGAILEPLGTAVRAAYEMKPAGATVAVIGCGPIGLFAIASARSMGAAKIFAIDVATLRLDLAIKVGADVILNSNDVDILLRIIEETSGVGVDILIDASGSVDAIRLGFKYLRKGGRVALIGLPSRALEIDLGPDVVFKEAKVLGIHGREMFGTWTMMENLLKEGRLKVDPIITHKMSLVSFSEGFELLKSSQACKVILKP